MQGNVAQALALVTVGNAALAGRDVRGFWPGASVFRYTKLCEFLVPAGAEDWRCLAADPLVWFEILRPWSSGLRLHTAPRPRAPSQMPLPEYITTAFVGGGPRWLIEAVGPAKSQIWQGFDRLLDRHDLERKIWASGYLLQGESEPQHLTVAALKPAADQLSAALAEVRDVSVAIGADAFTACFDAALGALNGNGSASPDDDLATYADLDESARRLLTAARHAWVFGGMGSWNDIGGLTPALNARYEASSENLFEALQAAITAAANSTYRS